MGLVKYKNPVEYSFHMWINNHPASAHPCDRERFYTFAKNVCIYHASKWKDSNYLENKILEKIPNFDLECLERILIIYESLLSFFRAPYTHGSWVIESDVKITPGYYIERGIKNGKLYEIEKPMPDIR